MLDASPLSCQLWDSHLNLIDCNEAVVRRYGLRNKREYMNKFYKLSPELQPDGQPSYVKAIACLNMALEEGRHTFEWMHCLPDGTPMPVEVTVVRLDYKDGYLLAGYTQDIR
jgi:PAS domain-containing protein